MAVMTLEYYVSQILLLAES